jgi:hypothetical protein
MFHTIFDGWEVADGFEVWIMSPGGIWDCSRGPMHTDACAPAKGRFFGLF